MIKAEGTMKVSREKSRIAVETSSDILDYYEWFIKKKYWIKLQKPLYGAHITIYLDKFHKNVDWVKAQEYDNKKIQFDYDPYPVRGGFKKGFIMFYLKVYSSEIEQIKENLGIVESEGYRGLHLTIGNSGKSGSVNNLYWPEMISIKN